MYQPPSSMAPSVTTRSDATGVHIRLLGEFAMEFQGQAFAGSTWNRSHARRLVQLLCSAPKLSQPREGVLASLWPGSEDEKARNRLHHTVHCIRKAWAAIPSAQRPQILVTGDRVSLVPGADTVIDVQVFLQGVESDCVEADLRLAHLSTALDKYRGSLAPDWDDCAAIEARRVWLEKLRVSALQEAVDTAIELAQPQVALHHAHQLALLLETDCAAHCQYAELLADNQRPDAALLHCQDVRRTIKAEDPSSLALLDTTVQGIQQRANRRAGATQDAAPQVAASQASASQPLVPSEAPAPHTEPGETTAADGTRLRPRSRLGQQGLVSRLCVAMPPRSPVGYDAALKSCIQCIEDPYGSVTSLVGPPGAGKSLLAHTVAYRLQSQMQHGALHIDCTEVRDLASLLAALASGLDPLCGPVAADALSLAQVLQNKELLIVLDNLCVAPSQLSLADATALAGRDTRWLVTAWSARHLLGERLVHLEPSQLLVPPAEGGPSHAAQILLALCAPVWRSQDARSLQMIEKVCLALDGLPLSLEIAGQCLRTMSPSELLARLDRDPCALMRVPLDDADAALSPAARLSAAVSTWLLHTTADSRRMLALLSRCQTWLTREDIACLMGRATNVDTLIEHCVRHQFLLRRARPLASAPWSEFRVPRVVLAALRLCQHLPPSHAPAAGCDERVDGWLVLGHLAARPEPGGAIATASRWFDDHMADLDARATSHVEATRLPQLAALCVAHAPHWSLGRHAARLRVWLEGLGDAMVELSPSDAATLFVARARLRVHLGELHLACDDASRALARVVGEHDAEVRQQAVQLIARYGVAKPVAASPSKAQSSRGVEAGESLLRVAQLAVRHGQLPQAQTLCGQALEVFNYFGLSHGLLKAHHYRAKIAFGLGDTELALRCLSDVERTAQQSNDHREAARAGIMRATVLASQMRFAQAIEVASQLIAQPTFSADAALVARGTSVVAWAQYGQGAYPLARAMCQGLRELAGAARGVALQIDTEILSALVEARSQRPEAALRSACAALDLLIQNQPLSDTQSDLVNAAELAHCLNRDELAWPVLHSLKSFAAQPDHRLRDWVAHRMQRIADLAPHGAHPSAGTGQPARDSATAVPSVSQVLASLTAA